MAGTIVDGDTGGIKAPVIRVGDRVYWRGGWGRDTPRIARVTSISYPVPHGDKYGPAAVEVPWDDLDRCVVDLEGGHWAYGHQIEPLREDRTQDT